MSKKDSPIRQYKEDLWELIHTVPQSPLPIFELARLLRIHEFQIRMLIKEDVLQFCKSSHGKKISTQSIQNIKDDPQFFIDQIPLSTLELQNILELSADEVGDLISRHIIKAFCKKKRKGHLRSLFRLGELIQKENLIAKHSKSIIAQSKSRKVKLNEKYQVKEDELKQRSVSTAERPDPSAANLQEHTGHVSTPNIRDFVLDPWQVEAIESLERGEHVFVQAPTGSGKTAIVEEYIKRSIDLGTSLFYAVPIKALANDKFFDFCRLFGRERVGINTGDITLNPEASIVVGTTEIVRNILFDRPDAYNVIAYDEAQYLGDPERGGAWEESIIMCDDETILVFLSGSVANGDTIAGWIETIKKRKVNLFKENKRPVPLRYAFPYGDGFLKEDDWNALRDLSLRTEKTYYEHMSDFFVAIREADMHPLLLFMPRRRDCEEVFQHAPSIPAEEQKKLHDLIEAHPEKSFLNLQARKTIIEKGCAYHHSGLLPPEKRLIETLAKHGHLRVISATMSLASGVNFSVRTCMISDYSRPGFSGNMQPLSPSEILQMWGRAGRRRLDVEGYVIPCQDIRNIDRFTGIEAYPEPIERDNFVSPVNILSILRRFPVEVLNELCHKSLSSYVEGVQYKLFSDETMFADAGAICASPTYELPPYRQAVYRGMRKKKLKAEFRCGDCSNLERCTETYENDIKYNNLQRMVKHLRMNHYLTDSFTLSEKGLLAERFHSEMGLLVAHHITQEKVSPDNLIQYAATVSAPGHVDFTGARKRLHLDVAKKIYPTHLFPTLWERHRGRQAFVSWNPGAGQVAKEWLKASDWESFANQGHFKKIQGDVFRMLLRTGELLKSMSFLGELQPELAEAAKACSKLLMRPPLIPEELFKQEE